MDEENQSGFNETYLFRIKQKNVYWTYCFLTKGQKIQNWEFVKNFSSQNLIGIVFLHDLTLPSPPSFAQKFLEDFSIHNREGFQLRTSKLQNNWGWSSNNQHHKN